MNTLRAYIFSTINADTTLRALLGGAGQIRHRRLPKAPTLTAAKPAWVVFAFITQGGRAGSRMNSIQEGDVLCSIDIYSRTSSLAWSIKERIHALIGNKMRTSATAKKALNVTEDSFNDVGQDPVLKCEHLNVTYRLAGILP